MGELSIIAFPQPFDNFFWQYKVDQKTFWYKDQQNH